MRTLVGVNVLAGDGSKITVSESKTGEVLFEATLPVGSHNLTQFQPLFGMGQVEFQNLIVLNEGNNRTSSMPFGKGSRDSGANPSWRPQFSEDERIARIVSQQVARSQRENEEKRIHEAKRAEKRLKRQDARAAAREAEREAERVAQEQSVIENHEKALANVKEATSVSSGD